MNMEKSKELICQFENLLEKDMTAGKRKGLKKALKLARKIESVIVDVENDKPTYTMSVVDESYDGTGQAIEYYKVYAKDDITGIVRFVCGLSRYEGETDREFKRIVFCVPGFDVDIGMTGTKNLSKAVEGLKLECEDETREHELEG